jgi:FAD/FMN-containing dehydrogenase
MHESMTSLATALKHIEQSQGSDRVVTDEDERSFYSSDVYASAAPCAAVLRPQSIAELRSALRWLASTKAPLVVRGGGLSYTDAFLPTSADSVCIDMQRVDQIVEINTQDRYAIVEAGCTWAALRDALSAHGLRTPYFGPLSGLRATVGGAVSQGSVFLGSARYGSVGDSVLGIEVALANGELLRTGVWAAGNAAPFFRYFGPDCTGLFVGDAGALGIKTRIALKLLPAHAYQEFLSFEYAQFGAMASAMSAVTRAGLASECCGFDPVLTQKRMQRASLMADARTLGDVVKKQGVLEGLKLAVSGRNFIGANRWSAHVTLEADSSGELRARLEAARALLAVGGDEIENSIPKVLNSQPFAPPNNMLGPKGERWVPVHGIVPHSQASAAFDRVQSIFERESTTLASHQIDVGYLATTIAHQGFLLEPVFYWPEAQTAYHQRMVEPAYLKRVQNFAPNPAASAVVGALKREVADALRALGAAHFQLGKFYRFRHGRDPLTLALHDAIKRQLDPDDRLNPGALI